MALSWNEIKDRALNFSKEWEDASNEEADAKPFLDAFFDVFGIPRKKVGTFEHKVKKLNDGDGYIDLFWKGTILIEMKSKGKDLKKAFQQAIDYTAKLAHHELPKYILVCDFQNFRLYDTEEEKTSEFKLNELLNNVALFSFIAGYQKKIYKEQDPANIKAAELMGKFHDSLKEIGYEGHPLELYLVRILFCLFAEDTTIFDKQQFQDYIEKRTNIDGSDLASKISELFQVLNTPIDKRFKNLDEELAAFPYVNGKLFEEILPSASFDKKMRLVLLDCCYLDWSKISPAIFGSMFQSVMNPKERRNLGAHYTSEKNILKLIKPLFLDALWEEFEKVKSNINLLKDFHRKISKLKFLDPACGCGNFLVITYRELRLLELAILRVIYKSQQVTNIGEILLLDVDMMYGIEYEEFPARIAEVAMWLIDHQMNMMISNEFGHYFIRLPLKKSANITHGNALRIDWDTLIKSPLESDSVSLKSPLESDSVSLKSPLESDSVSLKSPLERGFRGVFLTNSSDVSLPETKNLTPNRIIIPYNPKLKEYARNLRNNSTKSEIHFWSFVKGKINGKYDFHRQKPLLEFIADFFCYELKLVIELDGITHYEPEQIQKDLIKEIELNNLGLNVLRFTDDTVLNHTDFVLDKLNEYITSFEENNLNNFNNDIECLNKLSKNSPEIVMQNGINEIENTTIHPIKDTDLNPLKNTPLNPLKNTPLNPLSRGDFEEKFDYIFGNPPFYGAMWLNQEQREDVKIVMGDVNKSGVLDYVSCWYVKASSYIQNTNIKVAFVSTNSISQGEQVGILWKLLYNQYKIKIHFAHQTFKWGNEAKGNAAVHCVIIGFGNFNIKTKYLYCYDTINSDPQEFVVSNINAYLLQSNDIIIETRPEPINKNIPKMTWGNQPRDGGNFILSEVEFEKIKYEQPELLKFVRLYLGGKELINNTKRYCLWLKDINPNEISIHQFLLNRIKSVKEFRLKSIASSTRKFANTPALFAQISQLENDYLAIPEVSSERRKYIPIGYLHKEIIASNKLQMIPQASKYLFGIITSEMHMSWMRYICGRLKSDFSYSNSLVYNNFPWPENPSDKQIKAIEDLAQQVLDVRAEFKDSSLAELYSPLTMPPKLAKVHNYLDKAVDLAYRPQEFKTEANRMEFLFELYEKYTANLFTKEKPKRKKKGGK